MKRLNYLASVLTLSAASFAASGALADCAQDLAQLKDQAGTSAASTSSGSGGSGGSSDMSSGSMTSSDTASNMSGDGATSADSAPADMDQAAVNSDNPTYTESGTDRSLAQESDATGPLTGVAPTAALEDPAASSSETESASNASSSEGENANADMTTTSSTESGSDMNGSASGGQDMAAGSGMGSDQNMVETHLAAAQMALDAGDEQACMNALDAARQAM